MLSSASVRRPSTRRHTALETIHDESSSSNTLSAAENSAVTQSQYLALGPMARFPAPESVMTKKKRVNKESIRKFAGVVRNWLVATHSSAQPDNSLYIAVTEFASPPVVPDDEWREYHRSQNSEKLGPVPDSAPIGQTPEEFDAGMRSLYGITRGHPIRRSSRYHKRKLSSQAARWQSPIPGRPLPFPRECTLNPLLQHHLFGPPPIIWSIGHDYTSVMRSGTDVAIFIQEELSQPATCPLVTHMYINGVAEDTYERFPWPVVVENKAGITCKDVIDKIYDNFQEYVGMDEYSEMNSIRKKQMWNASQARLKEIEMYTQVEGAKGIDDSDRSIKRIDYLGHLVMFRGLEPHPNGEGWVLYVGRA
ncbi:hypothetical protein AX16_010029 [Volvariella volvacea WC 439]|nr:hypothetical protein AX16_010029 [Volvariella volvacea WC 439]